MIERLPSGVADICLLALDDSWRPGIDVEILSAEERFRAGRFRHPAHRRAYETSRVLLRTVLSRYADVAPSAWRFETDRRGRPHIARPRGNGLHFSLTHTDGLVCVAVGTDAFLGIDAEDIRRSVDAMQIAARCFSEAERADLAAWVARDRQLRFFEYWTLKESLSKACGVGLAADLSRFSFRLAEPISVHFGERPREDRTWRFALFHPTPDHAVAVSLRRPREGDAIVRVREAAAGSLQ